MPYETEKVQKCVMSLAACVQSVGGSLSSELLNMTVIQFIEEIAAPNNITFVCSKETDKDNRVSFSLGEKNDS